MAGGFQFRLRTVFVVTTLAAVALWMGLTLAGTLPHMDLLLFLASQAVLAVIFGLCWIAVLWAFTGLLEVSRFAVSGLARFASWFKGLLVR